MTAYCAIGIQKLKTKTAITGAGNHTDRIWHPKNANPDRSHLNTDIFDTEGKELLDIVSDRIDVAWKRKEAVLMAELRLIASPQYFRPDNPKTYGDYNTNNLNDWIEANKQFLDDQFGSQCVKATVHLDEATPHIHAYIIPEVPYHRNSNKYPTSLSFAKVFGNKKHDFRQWQDKYAEAMKHLGLERGQAGRGIPHQKQEKFYRDFLNFIEDQEGYQLDQDITEIAITLDQMEADRDRDILKQERHQLQQEWDKLRAEKERWQRDRASLNADTAKLKADRDRLDAELQRKQQESTHRDRMHWAMTISQAHSRMLKAKRKGKKLNLAPFSFSKLDNGDRLLKHDNRTLFISSNNSISPKDITKLDAEQFLQLERNALKKSQRQRG